MLFYVVAYDIPDDKRRKKVSDTKSGLTTPFLVGTRQRAEGRWEKKKKTSAEKGVIKADLV